MKNSSYSVISFKYDGSKVRTINDGGDVWFVAVDVCKILGHSNPTEALRALDDDERRCLATFQDTLRNSEGIYINPMATLISESGLYALVFRSSKPEAKEFSRWVRKELLPAIRKTGYYELARSEGCPFDEKAVDFCKYELEPVPEDQKVYIRVGCYLSLYVPMSKSGYDLIRSLCEINMKG